MSKDNEKISGKRENAIHLLSKFYKKTLEDRIEIGILLESISDGGFVLLNLIFSLFLVIPTPPPVPNIVAVIIMFISFQMIIGKKTLWLPKFISKRHIPKSVLALLIEKSSIYFFKLERFTKHRFIFMNLHFAEKINIFMVFFLATLSLVPVIFANSIPGIAIILISFGMLNKDGLFIILGHLIGIFSIFVVWVMVIFGKILVFKIIDKYF